MLFSELVSDLASEVLEGPLNTAMGLAHFWLAVVVAWASVGAEMTCRGYLGLVGGGQALVILQPARWGSHQNLRVSYSRSLMRDVLRLHSLLPFGRLLLYQLLLWSGGQYPAEG